MSPSRNETVSGQHVRILQERRLTVISLWESWQKCDHVWSVCASPKGDHVILFESPEGDCM